MSRSRSASPDRGSSFGRARAQSIEGRKKEEETKFTTSPSPSKKGLWKDIRDLSPSARSNPGADSARKSILRDSSAKRKSEVVKQVQWSSPGHFGVNDSGSKERKFQTGSFESPDPFSRASAAFGEKQSAHRSSSP